MLWCPLHLRKADISFCPKIPVYWSKCHKYNLSIADTCLKRTKILVPKVTALDRFHCSYKVVASTYQKREQLRKRRLLSHFSWYTFRELSLFISLCEFFSSVKCTFGGTLSDKFSSSSQNWPFTYSKFPYWSFFSLRVSGFLLLLKSVYGDRYSKGVLCSKHGFSFGSKANSVPLLFHVTL